MKQTLGLMGALVGLAALAAACTSPSSYVRQRPYIADKINCSDEQIVREGAEISICGYAFTARCRWAGLYWGTRCELVATDDQLEQNRALAARELFSADATCPLGETTAEREAVDPARVSAAPTVFRVHGCGSHIRYGCDGGTRVTWATVPTCKRVELLNENYAEALTATKALFASQVGCSAEQIQPLRDYPRFEDESAMVEVILQGCAQTRAYTCPRFNPEDGSAAVCADITPDADRSAAEDRAAVEHFTRANKCSNDQVSVTTLSTRWGAFHPRETFKRVAGCGTLMDVRCIEASLSAPKLHCKPFEVFEASQVRSAALKRLREESGCNDTSATWALREVRGLSAHMTLYACNDALSDLVCTFDPVTDTAACAPDEPMRALRRDAVAAVTEAFSRANTCPAREVSLRATNRQDASLLRFEVRGCGSSALHECRITPPPGSSVECRLTPPKGGEAPSSSPRKASPSGGEAPSSSPHHVW